MKVCKAYELLIYNLASSRALAELAAVHNEQAVRVATRYTPAPLLLLWAPQRLARRRADAT